MGCGYPDRLYRAVRPQLGQDVNGRLVAQLPENADLASHRPAAGKTADRSDANVPVCPSLGGVETVPLVGADARTASEILVPEQSLADGIKQPRPVDLTSAGTVSHCLSMPVNGAAAGR